MILRCLQLLKIFNNYKAYLYSSYFALINNSSNYCVSEEVLHFFGGIEKFIELHEKQIQTYYDKGFPDSKLE